MVGNLGAMKLWQFSTQRISFPREIMADSYITHPLLGRFTILCFYFSTSFDFFNLEVDFIARSRCDLVVDLNDNIIDNVIIQNVC